MPRRDNPSLGTKSRRKKSTNNNGSSPRERRVKRTKSNNSSGSATTISSISSEGTFDTTGLSVTKTLTLLRSQAANRSCADCRSALIDPSTEYASLCMIDPSSRNAIHRQRKSTRIALQDFQLTHRAFAPSNNNGVPALVMSGVEVVANGGNEDNILIFNENGSDRKNYDDDLSFSANRRFGGHGVLICDRCAEAHRQLGIGFKVHRIMDSSLWTMEEAHFIVNSGGNARCWKVYEAYVPDKWKERRPSYASSLSTRLLFCKAKYEALAFCLPPPGPLAEESWKRVLQCQEDKYNKALGSANLKNICCLSLNLEQKGNDLRSPSKRKKDGLPNRLIDYFCVVSSSMQFISSKIGKKKKQKKTNYANLSSPESLDFWPHLSDCYPPQNTYGEMGYQNHISSFVMPGGCHPTLHPKPPSFSTFVLTMADGAFVYGGALTIYDEHVDAEEIKNAMRRSGYHGEFPAFLMNNDDHANNDSDVFFFPKCLVFLSQYAFFNLFRSILLEIYQISLIGAPLPIERYVSNFVSEIPLPPQGKIKVGFSFSSDKKFFIERPPINELPLADFSFRPLFASLSVSNIVVVLGYLLQECKIVLLSKHYSILTPVAEALLSAIFPFRWVGLYIPVAPLKMMEILEAPIPYVIGMSSEYFTTVEVRHRPKDAILVDLDRDVIHIGDSHLPKIPERDAQKLTKSLEEAGGSAYVIPNSGIKGCIMAGSKKSLLLPNEGRPKYAQMTTMTGLDVNSFYRDELFSLTDLAYGGCDDEAERTNGFGNVNGRLVSAEDKGGINGTKKARPFIVSPIKKPKFARNKKAEILSRSHLAKDQGNLLDMVEPEGFSVTGIRNGFLRYVVGTFSEYQDSLLDGTGRDMFDEEKFVEDACSRGRSTVFLKNVLETQLFRRFLEERKDNSDLPEIRFFDESIIAKRNRSKTATLANGGKKPTPFLDDKSTWEVRKIYTPPTPNNFGLPDTEATYRYGTFPVLDGSRFGRIRLPVQWPQHTSFDSIRYKKKFNSKMKKAQNEIVKNALRPVLAVSNSIAASAKRTAKDLESSLVALAIVPMENEQDATSKTIEGGELLPSQGNLKTLSTADTIMMDARRKQFILLDVIIRIQALYRGHLVRNCYGKSKDMLLHSKPKDKRSELGSKRDAFRDAAEKRQQLLDRKATVIQCIVRMLLAQKRAARFLHAIIVIQTNQRASIVRQKWKQIRNSAIVVSRVIKGRRATLIFRELRRMVILVQSRVRGVLARSRMKVVMEVKMTAYTSQIFALWRHLHVSLIYRSKFWPELSGRNSFISLRSAEAELLKLWNMAGFSETFKVTNCSDDTAIYCDSIGVSNDVYHKCKKYADWIQSTGSTPLRDEEAIRKEEAERLQVYERLTSSVKEEDLSVQYRAFGILPSEKLRKVSLSQKIWTVFAFADSSASFIGVIFPELKNSLGIDCTKPSPKGKRRFPNAQKVSVSPIDRDLWEDISIEGKTKRHVQEVAMLFITKVPALMSKLDSIGNRRKSDADSFFKAAMDAHCYKTIKQTKRVAIKEYLGEVPYKKWMDDRDTMTLYTAPF